MSGIQFGARESTVGEKKNVFGVIYLKDIILMKVIIAFVIICLVFHNLCAQPNMDTPKEDDSKNNFYLELLSWSCSETEFGKYGSYTYAEAKGEVKNISGDTLRNVVAHAKFFDEGGALIVEQIALINNDLLLPGQISSFVVMEGYKPVMYSAGIQFEYINGKAISPYQNRGSAGTKKIQQFASHEKKMPLKEGKASNARKDCDLELLSWNCSETELGKYGSFTYAEATGEVKNISGDTLRNVVARVSFFDECDALIVEQIALIKHDFLLPGQISPFVVMEGYKSIMHSAEIQFEYLNGKSIIVYNPIER